MANCPITMNPCTIGCTPIGGCEDIRRVLIDASIPYHITTTDPATITKVDCIASPSILRGLITAVTSPRGVAIIRDWRWRMGLGG